MKAPKYKRPPGLVIDMHSHRPKQFSEVEARLNDLRRQPLNTLFPEHALVISLPRSKDRLDKFLAQNTFSGTMKVIEAVDGKTLPPTVPWMKPGDLGCLKSHQNALIYARDKKWPCVMIFEDDVIFVENFNEKIKAAMKELPANWDLMWLGGNNNTPPISYSSKLKVLTGSWGTFGMVIRNTVYDYFIEQFGGQERSSDDYYRIGHSKFVSFRSAENLVIHVGGVSDRLLINHG